jgi:predicted nuclease of restriction endonuclease-like RecB superfamily
MSNELKAVLAIMGFFGDDYTNAQAEQLSAMINQLSIADKDYLYNQTEYDIPSEVYTDLSMRNGEMGGFHNW